MIPTITGTPDTETRYRAGLISTMTAFAPTLFVTFVFNRAITISKAEGELTKFRRWVYRSATGKRRGPGGEMPYMAAVEHEDTNLHIHALFNVPSDLIPRFEQHGPRLWQKIMKSGNLDIQAVSDVTGVAHYITKELTTGTSHQLLLSPTS